MVNFIKYIIRGEIMVILPLFFLEKTNKYLKNYKLSKCSEIIKKNVKISIF